MARIFPEGWQHVPAAGAVRRKLDTLAVLAARLPASVCVFHGIHWSRVNTPRGTHGDYGELDFVLVGPGGNVVLIEQRSGLLDEDDGGLTLARAGQRIEIGTRLAHSAAQVRARLAQVLGHEPVLDYLLYCPDYHVRNRASAGLDAARIVDAGERAHLVEQLARLLAVETPVERSARARVTAIEHFFADVFELVPDVRAQLGQIDAIYTRLAGGLTDWARRIEVEPHRIRVTATAGSGKTQLALALLGDAARRGERALYVCYNRPLADHISRLAPRGTTVASYHQLCNRALRAHGQPPDFRQPNAFRALEDNFAALPVRADEQVEVLIIDEGQDFRPVWPTPLLARLAPGGQAWWLEDPLQNLYERDEIALPGWVRLKSSDNYRSPQRIVEVLQRLPGVAEHVHGASPLVGEAIESWLWRDADSLRTATTRALTRALALGFAREATAVLTFRGREHSQLTGLTRLGPHKLRSFTGGYDLLGEPEYSSGEVLLESVHRFKGQATACVVLTEVAFDSFDTHTVRKLFVALTRVGLKLLLVATPPALRLLGLEETVEAGANEGTGFP